MKTLLTPCIYIWRAFKYFSIGFAKLIVDIPYRFINGFQYLFMTKKTIKEYISSALLVLSLIIYLGSIFIISRWINQNRKITLLTEDIIRSTEERDAIPEENGVDIKILIDPRSGMETAELPDTKSYPNDYYDFTSTSYVNINFSSLLEKNSDTVGWILVPGTKINYPVVQTTDNAYYLSHAFNKSSNYGGWVFGDYRNTMNSLKQNTIIYGHALTNKTMFGSLKTLLTSAWQKKEDNRYIKVSTPTTNMVWKVFSTYITEPEVYYIRTQFNDKDEYQVFLDTITKRSNYNYNETLTTDDYVLTLSTCDSNGTKRLAVHAKLVGLENR